MGCAQSRPSSSVTIHANATISCPECNQEYFVNAGTGSTFYDHVMSQHQIEPDKPSVYCSFCSLSISDGGQFVRHLKTAHGMLEEKDIPKPVDAIPEIFASSRAPLTAAPLKVETEDGVTKNLPQVGDKVVSMWGKSQWQYFDATILSFDREKMEYHIEWDDQDPSGRYVSYKNIAVNRTPDPSSIGTGSVVLFHQGRYVGEASVGRLAGVRWHQGKITKIEKRGGTTYYSGEHTKGHEDGKWVTYKGYEKEFQDYTIEDLRCGPNVFDIMAEGSGDDVHDVDIFFSFTGTDSYEDVLAGKAQAHVDTSVYEDMVEPKKIIRTLEDLGYRVVHSVVNQQGEPDLMKIVNSIKSCKLFISCISNQYCNDDQCRMEIQYAKKSVRKPVIPLMVGSGGYDWQISVVGMLIAGELYIDFRDINVYDEKLDNCVDQVKRHFEEIPNTVSNTAQVVEEAPEEEWSIFISYCWTNSWNAKEKDQIKKVVGSEYSDPRRVHEMLASKYNVWLDIERLSSGQTDGMFEQIAKGLHNSKVVIVFVSTEYARSENCKMEFQFASKSLRKPVVPVSVGEGTEWDQTVIGALVASGSEQIHDLQAVTSEAELDKAVDQIMSRVDAIINPPPKPSLATIGSSISALGGLSAHPPAYTADSPAETSAPPAYDDIIRSRAPYVGAHVVSHHMKEAYYTATIVSFDKEAMTYTVDWDDGDPSGKVQKYNKVALNVEPDEDDIGVGQIVFFPQGRYGGTAGNNTGGGRFHEGIIDGSETRDGVKYFYGHHNKGADDGKWVTYQGYKYEFQEMTVKELRVAPNAMACLQAFQSLF